MKANSTTHQAVKAALDNWADSYAKRDIKRLLAGVAPDPDVLMYGTGADEKRIGLAGIQTQAERDWAQTDAAAFIFHDPAISAAGSVAWASADATFKVEASGQQMAFPARFTGVFEKREDQWLVVQAHFSLPAPDQAESQSFPA
ncbi:MAG: nuclear transport factor 2 family protein [Chloroflexi bacterium]|nr:nuclear transport factor 2 family protein [Chloroflexota bacterium]